MKKIISLFFSLMVLSSICLAVPEAEMSFGGMDEGVQVENDFNEFWQQAYPEMEKIFGQPYSSFSFTVEVMDLEPHAGGWDTVNKKVMRLESVQDKQESSNMDYETARDMEFVGILHELSHAMYTYDDKAMGFLLPWINEGWAKTNEITTWMRTKVEPPRPTIYLAEFLDKDLVAGTQGLGRYKQKRNHILIYDAISMAHLNLLYGCSDSNSAPDFQKRMNEKIYDEYVVKNKLDDFSKLPLEEYKKIIKELCADREIEGKDAYEWYFSQPPAHTKGAIGFQLGVFPHYWGYTTVEGIDVFTFNRVQNTENEDKSELGVKANVEVEVFDTKGNKVFSENVETNDDGDVFINFGRDFLEDGSYYVTAKANYQGKQYQSKMFFVSVRDNDGTTEEMALAQPKDEVIGIMVDKDFKPLDSRYLSLLDPLDGAEITANNNGLLLAKVPSVETKEISFDFLDQIFTFTKPPFRRVIVFQLSDGLIAKAKETPDFGEFIGEDLVEEEDKSEKAYEGKGMKELKDIKSKLPPPPRKTFLHWILEKLTRLFGFG